MQADKLIESLGFTVFGTGGGCEAYRKDISDGQYILITSTEDADIPFPEDQVVALGIYNAEDELINSGEIHTFALVEVVEAIETNQPW